MFRNYPNTFSSEEAIFKLGSLNISSGTAARATSTTTLKLEKDMAKALIQQFIWTRLIENAVYPQNRTYRDKGVWRLKSKGLCVLQNFCMETNRMELLAQFRENAYTPSIEPMFLIHVERMMENDRMNRKRKYFSCLFAIMVASLPFRDDDISSSNHLSANTNPIIGQHRYNGRQNMSPTSPKFSSHSNSDLYSTFAEHSLSRQSSISSANSNQSSTSSIEANLITNYFPHIKILPNDLLLHLHPLKKSNKSSTCLQQKALLRNLRPSSNNKFKMRAIFTSLLCCEWLVEYCTLASNDEAENVMTEFLDLGWIAFFDDKNKNKSRVESSKSVVLKLTGTGMKVIIDVSSTSEKQQQQQQQKKEEEDMDSQSFDKKRYSVASSSSSNETGSSFSSSVNNSYYEDPFNPPQLPLHINSKQNNTNSVLKNNNYVTPINRFCDSLLKVDSRKSYDHVPYFGNCSTPFNEQQLGKKPFDNSILDFTKITSSNITAAPVIRDDISIKSNKESNSIKLKVILRDDKLRTLFREFLDFNLCVENLDFWVDHKKLRAEYPDNLEMLSLISPKKQQNLLKDAYILWNTYLSPGANRELNINHTLREDMAEEISNMVTVVNTGVGVNTVPTVIISMDSAYESLLTILSWFDRVNNQICKLMTTDSIPKFIKTIEYKTLAGNITNPQQEVVITSKKPTTTTTTTKTTNTTNTTNTTASLTNESDLDYFPPPPQRELRETLYL